MNRLFPILAMTAFALTAPALGPDSGTAEAAPGFVISPNPAGITVSEAGATSSFTIALTQAPLSNVSIAIFSNDLTEGILSPSVVTFLPGTWNLPLIVEVIGQDDLFADGNTLFHVVLSPASSADVAYDGLNPPDVAVLNLDNDQANIVVSPTWGLAVSEVGTTATFTVVLATPPSNNVTIGLSSTDVSEGTVSPPSLTFTGVTWATPQTVTITGVNDAVDDEHIAFAIVTGAATSADPSYSGRHAPDVAVTTLDDEAGFADIVVSNTAGHITSEAGGVAGFNIRLNSQPTANVTMGLTSSDLTEGVVSPSSLTFTTANWATPQGVTITGQDDAIDDENIGYAVTTAPASSSDPVYNGRNAPDVSLTNLDNEANGGFVIAQTAGHVTTEGGTAAGIPVSLSRAPTANVVIPVTTSDASEGSPSVSSLTFTPANFATPQLIVVTPANDAIADGNVGYAIFLGLASSSDASYNGLNPPDVSLTNNDDDLAQIIALPSGGLVTTENGGTAQFGMVLYSQPTANVTIPLSTSDATEGTVSPSSVTFTPANWGTPQTVTVTGVNDALNDCDIPYTIITGQATSSDPGYSNRDGNDVAVVNTDDEGLTDVGDESDAVSFTLDPVSPNPARGNELTIRFGLTSDETAEVELLDVAGRRMVARDVGELGRGRHTVSLAHPGLTPGMYWVRLTQGAGRSVKRVVIVQ